MKERNRTNLWVLVASNGLLGLAIGCQQQGETTSPPPESTGKTTATSTHDDHDHDGGEHGHEEHGPHDGELVELGKGKYHAEVVHDEKTKTVTVYLLDGSAKNSVFIDAKTLLVNVTGVGDPQQYELAAVSEEGHSGEGASRFQLKDEALCTVLHGDHVKARLTVDVDGKSYSGIIPVEDNDHDHGKGHSHGHEHGDKDTAKE